MKNDIIVLGCWINNKQKELDLSKRLNELKKYNMPIALVTHYPLQKELYKDVDYFIYDKKNPLSDNPIVTYWIEDDNARLEYNDGTPYHAAAIMVNINNIINMFTGSYDMIHYFEADVDLDFDIYFDECYKKRNNFFGLYYNDNVVVTNCFSFDIQYFKSIVPKINTWDDYHKWTSVISDRLDLPHELQFERFIYRLLKTKWEGITLIEINDSIIDMNNTYANPPAFGGNTRIKLCDGDNNDVWLFIISDDKHIEYHKVYHNDILIDEFELGLTQYRYFLIDKLGKVEIHTGNNITKIPLTDKTFKEIKIKWKR